MVSPGKLCSLPLKVTKAKSQVFQLLVYASSVLLNNIVWNYDIFGGLHDTSSDKKKYHAIFSIYAMFIAYNTFKSLLQAINLMTKFIFSVLNQKLFFLICLKFIDHTYSIVCSQGWCVCQWMNARVKMSESHET